MNSDRNNKRKEPDADMRRLYAALGKALDDHVEPSYETKHKKTKMMEPIEVQIKKIDEEIKMRQILLAENEEKIKKAERRISELNNRVKELSTPPARQKKKEKS